MSEDRKTSILINKSKNQKEYEHRIPDWNDSWLIVERTSLKPYGIRMFC